MFVRPAFRPTEISKTKSNLNLTLQCSVIKSYVIIERGFPGPHTVGHTDTDLNLITYRIGSRPESDAKDQSLLLSIALVGI